MSSNFLLQIGEGREFLWGGINNHTAPNNAEMPGSALLRSLVTRGYQGGGDQGGARMGWEKSDPNCFVTSQLLSEPQIDKILMYVGVVQVQSKGGTLSPTT